MSLHLSCCRQKIIHHQFWGLMNCNLKKKKRQIIPGSVTHTSYWVLKSHRHLLIKKKRRIHCKIVMQPYICSPLCTWLFNLHMVFGAFVSEEASLTTETPKMRREKTSPLVFWIIHDMANISKPVHCVIAGPSWPLCLDWTMRPVRGMSRSSTRHRSSPERAPRQVRPSERRHHGRHGNRISICLNVRSVCLQLGRNRLHLLELLQYYLPQQSRPSDSEDPVFKSWIFQLSQCVFQTSKYCIPSPQQPFFFSPSNTESSEKLFCLSLPCAVLTDSM